MIRSMIQELLFTVTVAASSIIVVAGQQARPSADLDKVAVFTEAQATAGKAEYLKTCVTCHTQTLIPAAGSKYQGRDIPPLAGSQFMRKWGSKTTKDLTSRVKIAAGAETYINVTAFILQFNGASAGDQSLTSDTAIEIRSITK